MTDLDVQEAAAKADSMVNPAFLTASIIEERAADIVEALNDMPSELAVTILLHLRPIAPLNSSTSLGWEREPELITLMPREAAAKLLAGVSADRLADVFHQVKRYERLSSMAGTTRVPYLVMGTNEYGSINLGRGSATVALRFARKLLREGYMDVRHEQVARERILMQHTLHQHGETVYALAHVDVAQGQMHLHV